VLNSSFSGAELAAATHTFIDFLLDESPLAPSAQAKAAENMINETGMILADLIWTHGLFRFEIVLLALTYRLNSSPNALPLLEHLLFKAVQFEVRLQWFVKSGPRADYWNEDEFYDKMASFHEQSPDPNSIFDAARGSNLPPLAAGPFFDNAVIRTLPALDMLMVQLVEGIGGGGAGAGAGHEKLLMALVDRFAPLYAYHDTPITFVLNLLFYYYNAPALTPTVTVKLVSLLLGEHTGVGVGWSSTFRAYLANPSDPACMACISSLGYVRELVAGLIYSGCLTVPLFAQSEGNAPQLSIPTPPIAHMMSEFPIQSQLLHARTLLELIASPVARNPHDLAALLLDVAMRDVALPPSSLANACGYLFAQLPGPLHAALAQQTVQIMMPWAPYHFSGQHDMALPPGLLLANLNGLRASRADNTPATVLAILHAFFHYANADGLAQMAVVLSGLRPVCVSPAAIRWLLTLVGPFIHRLSLYPRTLLQQTIGELTRTIQETLAANSGWARDPVFALAHDLFFQSMATAKMSTEANEVLKQALKLLREESNRF